LSSARDHAHGVRAPGEQEAASHSDIVQAKPGVVTVVDEIGWRA
jgi:hypothetical protein